MIETLSSVNLKQLENAVKKSWSRETCLPILQNSWSQDVPAYGQSDVTSLIIQNFLNGDILYCIHLGHYWNKIIDHENKEVREIDWTRQQYSKEAQKLICFDNIKTWEDMLIESTCKNSHLLERYGTLKRNVEEYWQKNTQNNLKTHISDNIYGSKN